uniref:Uncharacterized protein n=1 Tax=Caenorhabditis tropicalis TaxID=1561998 RepID=A0A1I7UWA4_9PELO
MKKKKNAMELEIHVLPSSSFIHSRRFPLSFSKSHFIVALIWVHKEDLGLLILDEFSGIVPFHQDNRRSFSDFLLYPDPFLRKSTFISIQKNIIMSFECGDY